MAYEGPDFGREPPADFNPKDAKVDPYKASLYRDYVVREKMVEIERAKLLKEDVRTCYLREGVNYIEKCHQEVTAYLDAIKKLGFER